MCVVWSIPLQVWSWPAAPGLWQLHSSLSQSLLSLSSPWVPGRLRHDTLACCACRPRIVASGAARPARVCEGAAAAASGAAQPAAARAQVTLSGHRGAVTALRYNRGGALLASGAQDTDAIVWDVVAEAGLFRLRAHSGQVTDLVPPRLGPCASTAPIARMSPLHAAGDACMPGTLLRRQHGPPGALQ